MRRWIGSLAADVASEDASWQRADALLADSLTSPQHAAYRARGFIEVKSRLHQGRTYRVDGWRPVAVYEHGQFVGAVCIRAKENLPSPDVLLARKLMIEGAESEFLSAGNWLQPAWRPAGIAPTIFLLALLLTPWLMHLRELGPLPLVGGLVAIVVPALIAWSRRRRR